MKGFCKIIDVKSRKVRENISYALLYGSRPDEQNRVLEKVYEAYGKKSVEISCSCGDVQMSVGKKQETYYLSTFPKQLEKHADSCAFRKGTPSTQATVYQTAVRKEGREATFVTMVGSAIKPQSKAVKDPSGTGRKSIDGKGIAANQNKMSMEQFGKWLLTNAWNSLIMDYRLKKVTYPTIDDMFKRSFILSKKLYLLPDVTLAEHFFCGSKSGAVPVSAEGSETVSVRHGTTGQTSPG